MEIINTTGRRKASVARVYMTKGTGKFVINGKVYTDYFPTENIQYNITDPFKTVEAVNEFDVKANVTGAESWFRGIALGRQFRVCPASGWRCRSRFQETR